MRFGDPGNPVKEECKWRNTNLLSSPVVFWGQRGWVLGLQFRDWRVGGGQNHHTGLNGGHIRDGGSHRVDVGVALGGGLGGEWCPNRPSGHPRGDTFECRCGTACGCG